MTDQRLRDASALLRERATAMNAELDSGHHYWPNGRESYSPGVRDGLGGASGDFCATMTPDVAIAVADWLDAEFVTQSEMEPLADAINASFTAASGREAGVLQFGRDRDGNVQFQANTLSGAILVAEAVLNV